MEKNKNKPQLTISLLISNRPDSIRKCLDSLRPIMEQIPCELILVDTSKNPDINKVLWEYTDKVYEFEWCDDFSKARNVGLKNATGEWFLFLDDDEWFVEIDELVDFFRTGEYKNYGYAHYQVRNFYDPSYTYYSDSWVSRMIRIDEDTEFRSKIHEYMYPVRGKYKHIYAMVYHSGYIFATEEQLRAHFERNSKLLKKMIAEEPQNLRWKIQMAQEYRSVKEHDTLCTFCEKCLEEMKGLNSSNDSIHLGTFYVAYIEAYLLQKEYAKAKEICHRAMSDERNTLLCAAFVQLALAEIAFCEEAWEEAKIHIQSYFCLQKDIEANQAALEEMSRALIVQEAYDDMYVKKAYSILIACDLKLNNSTELLEKYYTKLEWDKDVIYAYLGTEKVFVWAMATMKYIPLFTKIAEDAYRNATLRDYICRAAQEWSADEAAFYKVMYVFAQIEIDDWYIWYARMIVADHDKNANDVATAIAKFFDSADNVFRLPEKVYEIANAYDLDLSQNYLNILPDRWKNHVKDFVNTVKFAQLKESSKKLELYLEKKHWKRMYFELAMKEAKLIQGPKDLANIEAYVELMNEYAEQSLDFYGRYYREDVFVNAPEVLPEEVQAAIKLMEFIELEKQDKRCALERLKEAVIVYPFFSEGIKAFISLYPQLENQRNKARKKELFDLKQQVLAQTKELMEKNRLEEASQILNQVKKMFPNDLEIMNLVLEIRLKTLSTEN